MTSALRAIAPGPYVTIQDAGRTGWRRFGVAGCGAMDMPAFAAANVLVGNVPNTAALEFAHVGGTWEVLAESARIAVTGGSFDLSVDDVKLQPWRSHTLRRGQRIHIGGATDAVWGYLAVARGFNLEPQLGSYATHLRSGLGGLRGARIAESESVPLRVSQAPASRERQLAQCSGSADAVRIVLGPQDEYFDSDTLETFLTDSYRVTHRSDRMGTWLEGPALPHANGYNVVSDGLVPGCIQVPGGGQPVVLMMDCQTIGGYPKLGTIISADLPRFAQTRPGTLVKFAAIDITMAQRLYRGYQAGLNAISESAIELVERTSLPFWLRG